MVATILTMTILIPTKMKKISGNKSNKMHYQLSKIKRKVKVRQLFGFQRIGFDSIRIELFDFLVLVTAITMLVL